MRYAFLPSVVLVAATVCANAQLLDLTRRYQVIARKDAETLQMDLNKAGQAGIRLVTGSQAGANEVVLLLEKVQQPNAVFEYLVIWESSPAEAERRLGLAATQGFRLMPGTITSRDKRFGGTDLIMVMEKAPGQKGAYEYVLLDTTLDSSLQVMLAGAVDKGYQVAGMLTKKNRSIVILERPAS